LSSSKRVIDVNIERRLAENDDKVDDEEEDTVTDRVTVDPSSFEPISDEDDDDTTTATEDSAGPTGIL